MMTYEALSRKPAAFQSLLGMSVAAFETLYQEFEVAHGQRLTHLTQLTTTRGGQRRRQRAVGAGRRHHHSLRQHLLLALFWLRVYPTYAVLARCWAFSSVWTRPMPQCRRQS